MSCFWTALHDNAAGWRLVPLEPGLGCDIMAVHRSPVDSRLAKTRFIDALRDLIADPAVPGDGLAPGEA